MKDIFKKIPEIILIIGVLVFWEGTTIFNPIAIVLLVMLLLSLKKRESSY